MGLITGSFHKRTTQRLVAPIRVVVAVTPTQVKQAAKSICDSFEPRRGIMSNGEHLWIIGSSDQSFSVVYGPPAKNEPNTVVRSWKADVTSTVDGSHTLVQLEMTNWKTKDKKARIPERV